MMIRRSRRTNRKQTGSKIRRQKGPTEAVTGRNCQFAVATGMYGQIASAAGGNRTEVVTGRNGQTEVETERDG